MNEKLSAEQDQMLADAMATGKPSLLDRLNQFMWPECNYCAGWRGIFIGLVIAAILRIGSIYYHSL